MKKNEMRDKQMTIHYQLNLLAKDTIVYCDTLGVLLILMSVCLSVCLSVSYQHHLELEVTLQQPFRLPALLSLPCHDLPG